MPCRTTSRSPLSATRSPRSVRPIRSSRAIPTPTSTTAAARRSFPGLINCHAHLTATLAARLQRGLRISEFGEAAGAAGQPAAGRRSDVDGDRRRARGDSHRDDDVRRERRRHRPLCGGALEDRIAMGVRRIDPRQRERARSALAGRTGEGRDAALLAEAARRGHAAHRRSVQRVARQEQRPHQRVSRGRAHRDVVARAAESGARVCREIRSRLHDSPESEHRRVSVHGEVPWAEAGGVSRQARLPRPAPVRRPCALRRCRRDRAAGQVADDHFAPGQHGRESRRHPADPGAARSRLPDRARHRQQHQ